MQKIKGVLFDMDGVIIDSEPVFAFVKARSFAALGLPEEYVATTSGGASLYGSWANLIERYNLPYTAKELAEENFREVLSVITKRSIPESPNLSKLLGHLSDSGIKIACGSASSREYVQGVLKYLGIDGYFSALVCGDDIERPKPHPDTYLLAAQRLNLLPKDCIVVEDSYIGSLAARNAGIRCIGYKGNQTASNTDFSLCYKVVADLAKIIDIQEICA